MYKCVGVVFVPPMSDREGWDVLNKLPVATGNETHHDGAKNMNDVVTFSFLIAHIGKCD